MPKVGEGFVHPTSRRWSLIITGGLIIEIFGVRFQQVSEPRGDASLRLFNPGGRLHLGVLLRVTLLFGHLLLELGSPCLEVVA